MTELMLSDLPHIKYHNKSFNEEHLEMLAEVNAFRNEEIKKKGLAAAVGIEIRGKEIDGDALLKQLGK